MLNRLSLEFIAVSFALLCESAAFEETDKRDIWASGRHLASTPTTAYCAITIDMSHDTTWIYRVVGLLAARAGAGVVEGLPFQSFEMVTQHELAFRTLRADCVWTRS